MDKQLIITSLIKNHNSFITYMNGLTNDEYVYTHQQKWTAGQQLDHIVLCVKPLVQVFSMPKAMIGKTFGLADRPGLTYDELLLSYKEKLSGGGKAPERFVPATTLPEQKAVQAEALLKLIQELSSKIESFTEQELDTFRIPHPLLGNLTMREMLYNAIYHVEHHHQLAKQNLNTK